jgi:hypothetical protein
MHDSTEPCARLLRVPVFTHLFTSSHCCQVHGGDLTRREQGLNACGEIQCLPFLTSSFDDEL